MYTTLVRLINFGGHPSINQRASTDWASVLWNPWHQGLRPSLAAFSVPDTLMHLHPESPRVTDAHKTHQPSCASWDFDQKGKLTTINQFLCQNSSERCCNNVLFSFFYCQICCISKALLTERRHWSVIFDYYFIARLNCIDKSFTWFVVAH